jgi:hypothetical protein
MNDIRQELAELYSLRGINFVRLLKSIASRKEFKPLGTDPEIDSIGQANRILLNMTSDYNSRLLAKGIRRYFERTPDISKARGRGATNAKGSRRIGNEILDVCGVLTDQPDEEHERKKGDFRAKCQREKNFLRKK